MNKSQLTANYFEIYYIHITIELDHLTKSGRISLIELHDDNFKCYMTYPTFEYVEILIKS